jgi:glyoxylase-like metal-dependent hydrolase (beta-lactamase superfamily II)
MCPLGRRLINGDGGLLQLARLVCHVLLIEAPNGLILVDTGFGADDARNRDEINRQFRAMTRPRLDHAETAREQVRNLGFHPADVRHIVLTHLDIDHGGGLPDFPHAQVHLWQRELETMQNPPRRERRRYRDGKAHWAHGPRWTTHELGGDEWLGFESTRVLPDSATEILLIPLPGHTFGHTGVAVAQGDGWLLHCGDAYFFRGDVSTPPRCPTGLRIFQNLIQADGKLRQQNQERLRELARQHSADVTLICSHDPVELDRMQERMATPDSTAADTPPTGP